MTIITETVLAHCWGKSWPLYEFNKMLLDAWSRTPLEYRDTLTFTYSNEHDIAQIRVAYQRAETEEENARWRRSEREERRLCLQLVKKYGQPSEDWA